MVRQPRTVLAALTAACIVAVAVAAAQNPADRFAGVELAVVPVAGQVHMVQRPGEAATSASSPDPTASCSSIPSSRRWPTGWSLPCGRCRTARSAS